MKQTLFLLLGYPGSGKSTFSRQLSASRNMAWISSDELRTYMFEDAGAILNPKNNPAAFGALDYTADRLLAAGQSVIYDANNNQRRTRRKHEAFAASRGARMVVLWVNTPLEIAKQRETERTLPDKYFRFADETYYKVAGALEEPKAEEKTIVINGLDVFDQQLQQFDTQLAELG